MVAFLKAHGQMLDATEADATATMLAVASSAMNDVALATWLSTHSRRES
jgi:prophage maintenance system killer protein